MAGNLLVGQSGGPTMVINQSLIGIVQEAKKYGEIDNIYGALNGVVGIMEENLIDFRKESDATLEMVAGTPSAALGSCRHKPSREDCEKIFEVCKKYDVRYFFYIGGNDSAEAAHIVNSIARDNNYEIRVFHIPKTIDNDLRVTDHCPGYASAARYVAMSFMGNDLDNRSLPGIKIDIVMGRHAGFLTAAASLARFSPDAGPHLLYFPEKPVSLDKMADDIKKAYDKYGRCLVAVAEGVCGESGEPIMKDYAQEVDSHGNIQLSGTGALGDFLVAHIKDRLGEGYRVRTDTLGYNQRCFPEVCSEVDAREARMVGQAGVQYAVKGKIAGSVAIKRTGEGEQYDSECFFTELENVAKVTKPMPDEFINAEGNDVTQEFLRYVKPLIGKLPQPGLLKKYPV